MDEIYFLVGKVIHSFQIIENNLNLIIFCYEYHKSLKLLKDTDINDFKQWLSISDKPWGAKLNVVKELKIFEDNEIIVLDYLRSKRNYIAHSFFVDNFNNNSIEKQKKELLEIISDIKIIDKVLNFYLVNYSKK